MLFKRTDIFKNSLKYQEEYNVIDVSERGFMLLK